MTQWKTIEEYPNYEVSNTGLVRNKIFGKARKPQKNSKGYHNVILMNNGSLRRKRFTDS